jgi:hypothetical protein
MTIGCYWVPGERCALAGAIVCRQGLVACWIVRLGERAQEIEREPNASRGRDGRSSTA